MAVNNKIESRVNQLETKVESLEMQSALKMTSIENDANKSVIEYKHQIELLNTKVTEMQKRLTLALAMIFAIAAASGGNVVTSILQLLGKGHL